MLLTKEEVKQFIPQRPPILMVEEVHEYEKGESIITSKWLPKGDPAFEGHFPGFPLLPGVLLVEAAAQSGAILMSLDEQEWQKGKLLDNLKPPRTIGVLGGAKVRFKKPVFPDTRIFIHAKVEWFKHGAMSLKVRALNDKDQTLMSGSLTLSTVLKSSLNKLKDEKLLRSV